MGKGNKLKKGDEVTWQSRGNTVTGTVERKITSAVEVSGRKVSASPDEPRYQVRSAKSGRTAVHKPSALQKVKKDKAKDTEAKDKDQKKNKKDKKSKKDKKGKKK
jgi:hypothetical protein